MNFAINSINFQLSIVHLQLIYSLNGFFSVSGILNTVVHFWNTRSRLVLCIQYN